MRRTAALALAALGLAACGGADPGQPADPRPGISGEAGLTLGSPTAKQLAFRRELLRELESGTYGDCGCTGDERARERAASGKGPLRKAGGAGASLP